MQPQVITGDLGPKQKEAVEGPIDHCGPEMLTYICSDCKKQYPNIGLYFYGASSTRCIWCTKFPKAKNVRTLATQ